MLDMLFNVYPYSFPYMADDFSGIKYRYRAFSISLLKRSAEKNEDFILCKD